LRCFSVFAGMSTPSAGVDVTLITPG
jgi:hypothetical protein